MWACGNTDTGRVRHHNEDALWLDTTAGLFAVADGMGGHSGGSTASHMTIHSLSQAHAGGQLVGPSAADAPQQLAQVVRAAGARIYEAAREQADLRGMGTTLTCLWLGGGQAVVAHVGDSRCYLYRQRRLTQLTDDHSLVNEQVRAGLMRPQDARSSRLKNVITRSVGFEPDVAVDTLSLPYEPNDIFLLCSDGLTNHLDDAALGQHLGRLAAPGGLGAATGGGAAVQACVLGLIAAANAAGGEDNITALVVSVHADGLLGAS